MKAFDYVNPTDVADTVAALTAAGKQGKVIAGGIDLLGELKDYIETPTTLVNLKNVAGLNQIAVNAKGITIGALVTLTEITQNPVIQKEYTALAEAAHSVATPQIRNVGTLGGNLCQRPRCWYYRDEAVVCLKKGGTKCYAVEGENQYHAILGGGPSYIIHPSDCAPALVALGATIEIAGAKGKRTVPAEKFFILPTDNVYKETVLAPGEIVTSVTIPTPAAGTRSTYVKVRHKESYDWALTGAAAVLTMTGNTIKDARIVLSGVAPIPWRSPEAEAVVKGKTYSDDLAIAAGKAALAKAKPMSKNAYKVPLAQNTVLIALKTAATGKA